MTGTRCYRALMFCAVLLSLPSGKARAGDASAGPSSPAELFPPTTAAYAEVPAPVSIVSGLLEHPLVEHINALEEVQAARERDEFLAFQAGLQFVESQLGMTWREAVEGFASGGIAAGFDPATQGVAVVIRGSEEATLDRIVEKLVELGRADASNKGRDDPYKLHEYRGLTVYQAGEALFTTVGDRCVITNRHDLGRILVDRLLDGAPAESLASQPRFVEARSKRPADAAAWAWLDVDWLREFAASQGKPFQTQTDNPVAELLIGGLFDTLQQSTWMTAAVRLSQSEARLELRLPHDRAWITESREYFFGPDGAGAAPAPVTVGEPLLSLAAYRNVSDMWLRAGDLFPENIVDKFAEADSGLSLFFSGRDFGQDVLGGFEPTLQFVAARQSFPEDRPTPAIKIPAFALQVELRDPATAARDLKRTFISFIGFVNVTGAMQGNPQLELDMPAVEGFELVTARFLPRIGEEQSREAPIQFNFSPSAAFVGNRFILASTEGLARELAAAPSEKAPPEVNSLIELHGPALHAVLADNLSHLVAKDMLEKGHTREESERQINLLLKLVSVIRTLHLDLSARDGQLGVDACVTLDVP